MHKLIFRKNQLGGVAMHELINQLQFEARALVLLLRLSMFKEENIEYSEADDTLIIRNYSKFLELLAEQMQKEIIEK